MCSIITKSSGNAIEIADHFVFDFQMLTDENKRLCEELELVRRERDRFRESHERFVFVSVYLSRKTAFICVSPLGRRSPAIDL